MTAIESRNDWVFGHIKDITKDKDRLRQLNITYMLEKTLKMFKYDGLPDTIKVKDLETILQVGGFAIFAKDNKGDLYAFRGGLGGKPNPYYLPTIATITNPALSLNKNLIIDTECVVMLNDYYYLGLMPMFNKYSSLLVEAELSLKRSIINARIPAIVQADNDKAKAQADLFFQQIEDGETYGTILSHDMFEGLKSFSFSNPITQDLVEVLQYIKGSWYAEIGLNAPFNMKREAINEFEAGLSNDILTPFIENMLECRKNGVEKINKMFGTNITVDLDSTWLRKMIENENTIKMKDAEIKSILKEGANDETKDDANDPTTE